MSKFEQQKRERNESAQMDGLLAVLQPFQQYFSAISSQWKGDNERLCAVKPVYG